MKKYVLVTGGAGYIGSLTSSMLINDGYEVVILDDLSTGHKWLVDERATFVEGDFGDQNLMNELVKKFSFYGAMHFAGETIIPTSLSDPKKILDHNVVKTLNFIDILARNNINNFIISSSSAVYGNKEGKEIHEDEDKTPGNVYGESKLICEKILYWYTEANPKFKSICFRYFNAAGAWGKFGEAHSCETHLIPNILRAANKEIEFKIFGENYPTRDGTCIRDYTHIYDIAQAHLLALNKIDNFKFEEFNLGYGIGYTVKEVLAACEKVTGKKISYISENERPGDVAFMIADGNKARKILGWEPKFHDIEGVIETAWKWFNDNRSKINYE